tara:strand:+ start:90 stop:332 length:243 start_codon:yes stop_codon:yes gene_type:complete
MINEGRYMLALVNILYYQALGKSKEELQPTLFFDEETTDAWTLKQCRIQYVKDQLQFIQDGNLDDESQETWKEVFKKEDA